MNLLSQLNDLLTPTTISIATITGNKGGDVWIGETIGGGVVLLYANSDYTTSQKVYYDRLTGQILGIAPSGEWREFGV